MKQFIFTASFLLLMVCSLQAQFEVDKGLVLNGTLENDRQVSGLGAPLDNDALINAFSVQQNTVRYGTAVGSNSLVVNIQPSPSTFVVGSAFYIFISDANSAAVSITINGEGPYPIFKSVTHELEANDLSSGQIVQIVFDGNAFQLVSGRQINKRDCPTGFVEVNSVYCIEANQQDSLSFFEAAQVCGDQGGRLCSWAEWYWACSDTTIVVNDMIGDYEWANSTANGDNAVRIVGRYTCKSAATNLSEGALGRTFRCCYTR